MIGKSRQDWQMALTSVPDGELGGVAGWKETKSYAADGNNLIGVSFVAIYRRMRGLAGCDRWPPGKRSDTRGFCKLIRAAETGLVNWSRRFSDRMLLMIGNLSARYATGRGASCHDASASSSFLRFPFSSLSFSLSAS